MKGFLLYIILVMCCMGCRSVQYVPMNKVQHDSIYIDRFRVDSIYQKDSVYVYEKGDSVTIYKDRFVYRYQNRTDTIYIGRKDSVPVPYPVEKKLTAWQQVKVNYGGYAMIIVFMIFMCVVIRLVWKLKK